MPHELMDDVDDLAFEGDEDRLLAEQFLKESLFIVVLERDNVVFQHIILSFIKALD